MIEKINKNLKQIKINKKLTIFLSIISLILLFLILKKYYFIKEDKKIEIISECCQTLYKQTTYKNIEIAKPVLLYDGTKFTLFDIQIYELNQTSRNPYDKSKYIAIALDIEIDKNIEKIPIFGENYQILGFLKEKNSINRYFSENIVDLELKPHNPYSMKWAIEEIKYGLDLRLVFYDDSVTKLDPYYVRLAYDKESAQPNIFRLWKDYEKKSSKLNYVDMPRKIRGWITWIFKVNEPFLDEKVNYSFVEGLLLKYKNSSINLTDLVEDLGKNK